MALLPEYPLVSCRCCPAIKGYLPNVMSASFEGRECGPAARGETIPVRVWSAGKIRVVQVSVTEFPDSPWVSYKNDKADPDVVFSKVTDAGFEVADLTDELRALFHFKSQTTGPVVTVVADNTAASQAGLRRGDLIKKVLMDDVGSRAELEQRLQEMHQRGQRNAVLYVGGVNDARWVTIPLRL